MQPLHETAAQSANNSNTGAPAESAPQTQPVLENGPALPIHASAAIFPPMRESEFDALVADIREKGQLEAVWLWQGQVIDGRHRVLACQKLGLTPKTREWDGQGSLLEFIVSANLRRRHLKENQRAMIGARMLPQFEEEALLRKKSGGVVDFNHPANLRYGTAAHQVALLLSVSERSITSAKKLREHGIPSLISRVDEGKLAVSTAAKIAEFPPEEQQQLLKLSKPELGKIVRPKEKVLVKPPLPKEAVTTGAPAYRSFSGELSYTPENGYRLKLSRDRYKRQFREAARNDAFIEKLVHGMFVYVE